MKIEVSTFMMVRTLLIIGPLLKPRHDLLLEIGIAQHIMVKETEFPFVQDDNLVAQICSQLQDMSGKDDDMVFSYAF